jgi:hypothetical protein
MTDNQPRYTTKRLHDEIVKAKEHARREAVEDAAKVAETGDYYGQFQTAGDERRAKAIAERIRALATPSPETRELGPNTERVER